MSYAIEMPISSAERSLNTATAKASDKNVMVVLAVESERSANTTLCPIVITPVGRHRTSTSKKIDRIAYERFTAELRGFALKREGWAGVGSEAPDQGVVHSAIELLKKFPEDCLPNRVGLSSDGEVSLFWEQKGLYADFGVYEPGSFSYFVNACNQKLYGDDLDVSNGIPAEALKLLRS